MVFKHAALATSFFLSSLIHLAAADTCESVQLLQTVDIRRRLQLEYTQEQTNYWSTNCGKLKPSCILYPSSAQEVASIVKVLNENEDPFVIKSGGHNPNEGFSSIDGGPLISTKYLNEVNFDAASMTVRVGPGNDWQDVLKVLTPLGVTVVGGRIGEVGVGGFVLGGGLSFLSNQYGWAANNIVEFEVVLANATIVTASATSHSDLYKALKGGGNNYGIVTSYTMIAHPQGKIWGGNLIFPGTKAEKLLAAVQEWTNNLEDDKAAIIMTTEITALGALDIWIMFLFYDGPTPPPGTFDIFTDIGPLINNAKTRDYDELLEYNNFGVVKGSVYTITTETTPIPTNATVGAEVFGAYYQHWRNTVKEVIAVPGLIAVMAFQPIPKMMARKAREMGGDMIDLDDDVNRIIVEFNLSYLGGLDQTDVKVDAAVQKLYKGTGDLINQYTASGHLPKVYNPLFANDGYYRQDYFGRLRTTDFARSVRDQYDPEGFFATRTGGFKM